MEYNSLEEVVREDIELFNKKVRRPGILRLEENEGGGYYYLFSGKHDLWFGEIGDINAIVKALLYLNEHPARYNLGLRVY